MLKKLEKKAQLEASRIAKREKGIISKHKRLYLNFLRNYFVA